MMLRCNATVNLRATSSGTLNVQAAASGMPGTFEILAYTGGKLPIEGLPLPVVVDLQGLRAGASLPILIDHREGNATTLGDADEIVNDGRQIVLRGRVTGEGPDVERVCRMASKGHRWQASIGVFADPENQEVVRVGETREVNGQQLAGPFILAKSGELKETSVLSMGADSKTRVLLAAAAAGLLKGGAAMPTFEDWVKSLGLDPAAISEELKNLLKQQYEAAEAEARAATNTTASAAAGAGAGNGTNGGTTQAGGAVNVRAAATATAGAGNGTNGSANQSEFDRLITEERARQANELARIREIRARCAADATIMETAIREGWSADTAELHLLRARARSTAPAGHAHSHDGTCTLQALQGAMILRAGGRLDHPAFATPMALAMNLPQWLRAGINTEQRQRAMEAAWRYRDMSMVDLAREACRLDGQDCPDGRSDMIRAAFSGGSLTNIFTTNTQVLATYQETGDTTGGWTRESEVADFKTNERVRMTKSPNLEKLPRGGTADHMTRGDVGESLKIARYAKQFVIDEQDMIDDTFNALQDTPREMGLACARLRPDLVYAILLANPTLAATARELFNATDANLGSNSALTAANLKVAVTAMKLIQEGGVNLGFDATHLLVPPTLEFTAYELLESPTIVIAGTAGTVTERGSQNTLTRKQIKVVADERLENGVIDPDSGTTYAGSSSTWFLACAIAHTIEVAYRRGTGRAPQIESFKLDKGQWGMGWACKMDIGAKALDWKGLRKTTA
jgi:hypothetical protein